MATDNRNLPSPRGRQDDAPKKDTKAEFQELQATLHGKAFRERIAGAVPEEFRTVGYIDRLITSIFLAVRDSWNPRDQKYMLLDADRASLFRSAERIAKRGLVVGDNVAWLVPYKGEVQDQLGWKGAITLAMRSGILTRYTCQPVFENDRCDILLGTENRIEHRPPMKGPRGGFIGVYAVAWLKDATEPDIEWMDKATVDFIRSMSPGKNSPAWANWYTEMARAKVFKRLMKRQPTERPIDLEDMDDANAQTIEGVAETMLAQAPMVEDRREMPMDTGWGGQDDREREPVGDRDEPQGEPAQQQAAASRPPAPKPAAEPAGDEPHVQWRAHPSRKAAGGAPAAFITAFKAAVEAGHGQAFADDTYNQPALAASESWPSGFVVADMLAELRGDENAGGELDLGSME